ncbi:uncharacterized protein LOC131145088 [Malania oleifera]|uniref:uncharacterized protein LOC131145088 n=1 Tax=Malania oleifera TaxID=397392 RepID=UPI0025AE04B4|nr:uncharacterized protein LOC131145088 [Malania oleifera]
MAELQPSEALVAAAPSTAPPPVDNNLGPTLAPKRQRRPSVRLGDIGDQPATLSYESHGRRSKPWRFTKDPALASKSSKTRPLTNLVNGGDSLETLDAGAAEEHNFSGDGNLDNRRLKESKSKRGIAAKRVRSSWAAKVDDAAAAERDEAFGGREDADEGFREFELDGSESPVHSFDDLGVDLWHAQHRRPLRARASESRDQDAIELDGRSDRNFASERDTNQFLDDGVRAWLIELGLSRYAPIFEIHEVDDEVLPMLTLEDLKDMGINAVGSRRKMFASIQKLRKGLS